MTSDDRLHVFRETNFTNIFMKMISRKLATLMYLPNTYIIRSGGKNRNVKNAKFVCKNNNMRSTYVTNYLGDEN